MATLHEDRCTISTTRLFILQAKFVEEIRTLFMLKTFFQNHAFYDTLWKNNVEPDRPKMKIWRMRIAC